MVVVLKRQIDKHLIPVLRGEDAAWIACAIDSEGCIYWVRHLGEMAKDGRPLRPQPIITISNSNFEWIKRFAELTFSPTVTSHEHKSFYKGQLKSIVMYHCAVGIRERVEAILRDVMPFLIIKKAPAETVLQWFANNPRLKNARRRLSDDDVANIRVRYRPWTYGSKRLARDFGVSVSHVKAILKGRRRQTVGHV